jgi:hypothetical protein
VGQFQRRLTRTPFGTASIGVRDEAREGRDPMVVLFHGLGRSPGTLSHLVEPLEKLFAVALAELPGHVKAPADGDLSLAGLANRFAAALPSLCGNRPFVLVGESVGALVALGAFELASAVVAIEPPLRTGSIWPVHRLVEQGHMHRIPAGLLNELIGSEPTGRDHTDLLAKLKRLTEVVIASEPLMPPRPTVFSPSLVDEPERALLRDHPLVSLRVVEGGHDLVKQAPDECLAAIQRACRSVGLLPA